MIKLAKKKVKDKTTAKVKKTLAKTMVKAANTTTKKMTDSIEQQLLLSDSEFVIYCILFSLYLYRIGVKTRGKKENQQP